MTAIIVGVLALTIAVAGATYAWFAANSGAIGGSGNAAKLKLIKSAEELTLEFEHVLPGQSVTFANGQELSYEADRGGIIEFSIDAVSATGAKIYLSKDRMDEDNYAADATFQAQVAAGDYILDPSKPGHYYISDSRIKEILEVMVDGLSGSTNTGLTPSDLEAVYEDPIDNHKLNLAVRNGKIYTYVREAEKTGGGFQTVTVDFTPVDTEGNIIPLIAVHFLGEFGGNQHGSVDRPWEQEAIFEEGVGLRVRAVQATKQAVEDYLNDAALGTWLETTFNLSNVPSWSYVG